MSPRLVDNYTQARTHLPYVAAEHDDDRLPRRVLEEAGVDLQEPRDGERDGQPDKGRADEQLQRLAQQAHARPHAGAPCDGALEDRAEQEDGDLGWILKWFDFDRVIGPVGSRLCGYLPLPEVPK